MIKNRLTPNFRIRAKTFFLTYPQIEKGETKENFLEVLKELLKEKNLILTKYVLGEEMTENDNLHFHVLLFFSKTVFIDDPYFFDVKTNIKVYHGHYIGAKNIKGCYNYCTKQNNFLESPELKLEKEKKKLKVVNMEDLLGKVMNSEKLLLKYMENPSLVKRNMESLSWKVNKPLKKELFSGEDFNFPPSLSSWFVNCSLKKFRPILIIEKVFCSGVTEGIVAKLSSKFNVVVYDEEKCHECSEEDIVLYSCNFMEFSTLYKKLINFSFFPRSVFIINNKFLKWIEKEQQEFFNLENLERNPIEIIVIDSLIWSKTLFKS